MSSTDNITIGRIYCWLIVCLAVNKISCQDERMKKAAILTKMRDWGRAIFDSQLYQTGGVRNQFLVAAVVSKAMINDPTEVHLLDKCPIFRNEIEEQKFNNTAMICGTSAVILNTVDENILERSEWKDEAKYKNHSWHGEYMLLHEGILQSITQKFRANFSNEQNCEVLLYSYFIPCNYRSEKQPYRCFQLLMDYDYGNQSCKVTVIGYNTAYPATAKNLNETLENLSKRYEIIQLVETKKPKNPTAVTTATALNRVATSQTKSFQEVLHSCLILSPVVNCCMIPNYPDMIITFYVNLIVNTAVKKNNNGNGAMSKLRRAKEQIRRNIGKTIDSSLGMDCNMCPSLERLKLFVHFCTDWAFDLTDYFGTPTNQRMFKPGWKRYSDKWSNMYSLIKEIFWDSHNLKCQGNDLSAESLCTKKKIYDVDYIDNKLIRLAMNDKNLLKKRIPDAGERAAKRPRMDESDFSERGD